MKKILLLHIAFSFSTVLMTQKPLMKNQNAVQQTVFKMFDAFIHLILGNYGWIVAVPSWELLLLFIVGILIGQLLKRKYNDYAA